VLEGAAEGPLPGAPASIHPSQPLRLPATGRRCRTCCALPLLTLLPPPLAHSASGPIPPSLPPSPQALEEAGLGPEQVSAVELVGGSSRIPALQRILTQYFGREPSRTLNAKETVARGCALQCAMLSPSFK
jgi:hypothetical protein